jgi:hypothetical protein
MKNLSGLLTCRLWYEHMTYTKLGHRWPGPSSPTNQPQETSVRIANNSKAEKLMESEAWYSGRWINYSVHMKKKKSVNWGGEGGEQMHQCVFTLTTLSKLRSLQQHFKCHVRSISWLPHIIFTSMLCVTWQNKSIPDCWNILAACPEHRASHYDDHLGPQDISSSAW